jgi:SAM-dependent methyltransferase
MPRPRTLAVLVGLSAAATAIARHYTSGHGRRDAPGGILVGDAGAYDTQARILMGSFYRGIAADVTGSAAPGARVLEVGCGPGHLSILLAEHGLDVTGVDLDPDMIERARRNAERLAGDNVRRPRFEVGDAASLPFAGGSFELVVSSLSMHHWSDPVAGLAEIGRVLTPGGRALIWDLRGGTVPFHRHVVEPLDHVAASPLRLVSATAWRWPWRFAFTRRIELEPAGGPGAVAVGTA